MPRLTDQRQPDSPEPGFFKVQCVRGAHPVPAQIIHEDETWCVLIAGMKTKPASRDPWNDRWMHSVWFHGERITQEEYESLLRLIAWAQTNQPEHPILRPDQKINPMFAPPDF